MWTGSSLESSDLVAKLYAQLQTCGLCLNTSQGCRTFVCDKQIPSMGACSMTTIVNRDFYDDHYRQSALLNDHHRQSGFFNDHDSQPDVYANPLIGLDTDNLNLNLISSCAIHCNVCLQAPARFLGVTTTWQLILASWT